MSLVVCCVALVGVGSKKFNALVGFRIMMEQCYFETLPAEIQSNILSRRERWQRLKHLHVCKEWKAMERKCSDLWSVVAVVYRKPTTAQLEDAASRLPLIEESRRPRTWRTDGTRRRLEQRAALHYVLGPRQGGAVPLLFTELAHIADQSWVRMLYVPDNHDVLTGGAAAQLRDLCENTRFTEVRQLRLPLHQLLRTAPEGGSMSPPLDPDLRSLLVDWLRSLRKLEYVDLPSAECIDGFSLDRTFASDAVALLDLRALRGCCQLGLALGHEWPVHWRRRDDGLEAARLWLPTRVIQPTVVVDMLEQLPALRRLAWRFASGGAKDLRLVCSAVAKAGTLQVCSPRQRARAWRDARCRVRRRCIWTWSAWTR